ncbi:hypothetical protein GH733_006677 [Mirounga leonina]|nr:hypothetical protein GH733_006677 [Mirounga leonina]
MPEAWKSQPALKLRGQMIWMESVRCLMYLCSPKPRSVQELEERKMHLPDVAPHDTTRELILLNQQRLAEIELSNQLERKKEELRVLSKHLAIEKNTETLLYAMLPQHVETIGNAYMAVGGVPVPIGSHAQRVANFALGMRISAKEVMNPITGEPIQPGAMEKAWGVRMSMTTWGNGVLGEDGKEC